MAFAVAPPNSVAGWRWGRPRTTSPRLVVVLAASERVGGERAPPTFGGLREELLQLHAEADLTQSKANSARVRLVRLTEAAENLKKRAATSVRMGKENEAVDLLVQKKKLTKALENIKERIEVLDRLSAKISEAISMKQNKLIEYALRPETSNGQNTVDEIRVFSNKVNDGDDGTENRYSFTKSVENKSFDKGNDVDGGKDEHPQQSEILFNDRDPEKSIKDSTACDSFLEHVDLQLKTLELQIEHFFSSQLVEEIGNEKQMNGDLQILYDILEFVKESRQPLIGNTDCKYFEYDLKGDWIWRLEMIANHETVNWWHPA